ncbi:MAG: FAD-dependent oxidoreductase [Candidatus Aminicenantes bacterium]
MLKKTDILIIGGGIVGICASYYLSKLNAEVTLIEKGEIGGEASTANAGTLAIQNKSQKAIPLAREGRKSYAELQTELGVDLEFRPAGGLRVAEDKQQFELLRQAVNDQKKTGLELELLSAKTLRDIAPYLGNSIEGASLCHEDSRINPFRCMEALTEAVQKNGVNIHLHEMLTSIQIIKKDEYLIQTTKGTYQTSCLLNCTGVWSKNIFRMINLDFPITLSPQQAMVTEKVPPQFPNIISHIKGKLTLKQVDSGNILIGGGWEGSGDLERDSRNISYESMTGNIQYALRIIPALKPINLIRCWIGFEGRTPDRLPLLGNLKQLPGFYTACCAKGGFTLGPVLAKIVTELIMTGKTFYPISDFDVNRFIPPSRR